MWKKRECEVNCMEIGRSLNLSRWWWGLCIPSLEKKGRCHKLIATLFFSIYADNGLNKTNDTRDDITLGDAESPLDDNPDERAVLAFLVCLTGVSSFTASKSGPADDAFRFRVSCFSQSNQHKTNSAQTLSTVFCAVICLPCFLIPLWLVSVWSERQKAVRSFAGSNILNNEWKE